MAQTDTSSDRDGSGVARHTDGHTDRSWHCPVALCSIRAGTALLGAGEVTDS